MTRYAALTALCFIAMNPAMAAGVIFSEGFEQGIGSWSASNGAWEAGTPTAPAGLTCRSGKQCVATILSGNHPNATSRLMSEPIQLSEVGANNTLRLRFWHWFSFAASLGQVQIAVFDAAAKTWSQWASIGDTFTSVSGTWTSNVTDLTAYSGKQVRIGFLLSYNCCTPSWGWYIDDIEITATADPSCDFQLSQQTYRNGDAVVANVARLVNPSSGPVKIELKTWFTGSNGSSTPHINVGSDGLIDLPAGHNQDYGPIPLFTVTAATPRGQHEFGCRLIDPVTGRQITIDRNFYTIQ